MGVKCFVDVWYIVGINKKVLRKYLFIYILLFIKDRLV